MFQFHIQKPKQCISLQKTGLVYDFEYVVASLKESEPSERLASNCGSFQNQLGGLGQKQQCNPSKVFPELELPQNCYIINIISKGNFKNPYFTAVQRTGKNLEVQSKLVFKNPYFHFRFEFGKTYLKLGSPTQDQDSKVANLNLQMDWGKFMS